MFKISHYTQDVSIEFLKNNSLEDWSVLCMNKIL